MKAASIKEFLTDIAERYDSRPALHIRRFLKTTRVSYRDLLLSAQQTAELLAECGIRAGDRVLLWGPNMPEWVTAFFGIIVSGAVAVPVDYRSSPDIAARYAEKTEPKAACISRSFAQHRGALAKRGIRVLFLEDLLPAVKGKRSALFPDLAPDTLAEIVFTSGTTGDPKGVMITHGNIIAEVGMLEDVVPHDPAYRLLSLLPLSHVMEQIVGVFIPLLLGATVFYTPRINMVTIRHMLKRYRITHMGVVPQVMRMFLDSIEREAAQRGQARAFALLSRAARRLPARARRILFASVHHQLGGALSLFGVGSAPLDENLARVWQSLGVRVLEGYGASETTGAVTANPATRRVPRTVGKPLRGVNVITSPDGEVLVQGPCVTPGYYRDEEKTKAAFDAGGYFRTGDAGHFDAGGHLYLTGREKFRIVTASGEKVYPEDVERALNAHPAVWDSCVFGVRRGDTEIIHAALILRKGRRIDPRAVIAESNRKLEQHQKITNFTVWPDDDFPRLQTLKTDRGAVRAAVTGCGGQSPAVPAGGGYSALRSDRERLYDIIAETCGVPREQVTGESLLVGELGLDSLKRVELVARIEDEFGVEIDEAAITPLTLAQDLESLLRAGITTERAYDLDDVVYTLRAPLHQKLRVALQDFVLFPLFRLFIRTTVIADTDLSRLPAPAIFVGNHPAQNDIATLLQTLPRKMRERLVLPADDTRWRTRELGAVRLGNLVTLVAGAFPISKNGGAIKQTLETMVDFIDDGYSMIVMPEGAFTPHGAPMGELRKGLGVLFLNTGVPIIPFHVSGDLPRVFAATGGLRDSFPRGRGRATLHVGKPFSLSAKDEDAAMALIRAKILELAPREAKSR